MIDKERIIEIKGNPLAKDDFALVQIGDRDIGLKNLTLSFPHYYYEEGMSAKDLFIEVKDLLEFYQQIKIVY